VSLVLSAPEVVGNPHRNDKSKAHAIRREHLAYYSISVFALKKFPTFLVREQ